jgi:hypothetical protein
MGRVLCGVAFDAPQSPEKSQSFSAVTLPYVQGSVIVTVFTTLT